MQLNPIQEDIGTKPTDNTDQNDSANCAHSGANAPETGKNDRRATSGTGNTTKVHSVIALMRRKRGATLRELANATGWQHHSIRGLISGTIKKKMLLNVVTEKGGKSGTRYRIETDMGTKS